MRTATSQPDLCGRVMLTVIAAILLHIMLVEVWECGKVSAFPEEPRSMSFEGDSKELKQTQIVPTLDTPITKGKNVIWCASFLAAWKKLQSDVVDEPVWLKGADSACQRLNSAHDPASDLSDESFYAVAGWVSKGIIPAIQKEMKTRFPQKSVPAFPEIAANSFLAYAYLEASVPFTLPYFQNRKPLIFTDSEGTKTKINSFGIRREDDYAYHQLRNQLQILFSNGKQGDELEFAIDLCKDSSPNQVVVARVGPEQTLSAALAKIQNSIAATKAEIDSVKKKNRYYTPYRLRFGPNDVLLVPDLFWRIAHHFSELEEKAFTNQVMRDQRMDVALQEVMFRLDRGGAELSSEAKLYMKPVPTYYVADRPFLLYIQKRNSKRPFFVMWVENAELLQTWGVHPRD